MYQRHKLNCRARRVLRIVTSALVMSALVFVSSGCSISPKTTNSPPTPSQAHATPQHIPFHDLGIPQALAVDKAGNVFVADDKQQVLEYKASSQQQFSWLGGSNVVSLAFDDSSNLLAAQDARISTVYVNTPTEGIDNSDLPLGYLNVVTGIAAGLGGEMYITTRGDSKVLRYDTRTNSIDTLATNIFEPRAIAVDNSDHIYVIGNGNNEVIKINIGSLAQTVLPLSGVSYIAVSPSGDVFTVSANYSLEKLSAGSAHSVAISIPNFKYPCAIVVDSSGNLIVANLDGEVVKMQAS
jgi:serine/threonine protein kinase, bacterial